VQPVIDPIKRAIDFDPKAVIQSQFGSINEVYSSPSVKSLSDLSKITGNTITVLQSINTHILDASDINPGIPLFYVVTPKSKTEITAFSQLNSAIVASEEIIRKITTVKTIVNTNKKIAKYKTTYNNLASTTTYGGKSAPTWYSTGLSLPGYKNAIFKINDTKTTRYKVIDFALSPSTFSDSRQNLQQMVKTNGGWFVMRLGKSPATIQLTGYMLDTKEVTERHKFLENYKTYIEDQKNGDSDYTNRYNVQLIIEGREYNGYIQNISFQKSAVQQFLYQYSIAFVALAERSVYAANSGLKSKESTSTIIEYSSGKTEQFTEETVTSLATVTPIDLSDNIYDLLNASS
jgi:hypothetical protein